MEHRIQGKKEERKALQQSERQDKKDRTTKYSKRKENKSKCVTQRKR